MNEISRILAALAAAPLESAALGTLVGVEGSSYRRPGARLLLLSGGGRIGSISGGCLEEDVIERARRVLATGQAEVVTYDTTSENDIVWGVGLGCQGKVHLLIERIPIERPRWLTVLLENIGARRPTAVAIVHGGSSVAEWGTRLETELPVSGGELAIFRETIAPPPELLVFGAGDDAQPLVRMACETGWRVTVVDSRAAYANAVRFPEAATIAAIPVEEVVTQVSLDPRTFAVVMTHRYAEDKKILGILLTRPLAYLGILGPRKRTERLLAELQSENVADIYFNVAGLYSPIGLDLGGSTPELVALSILAEMQACLSKRAPVHLRDRPGPIHG